MFTWTEEKLLELATSLPAMRAIRHQPRGLRQRTCTILKKLATLAEIGAWTELLRTYATCCLIRLTRAVTAPTPCSRALH